MTQCSPASPSFDNCQVWEPALLSENSSLSLILSRPDTCNWALRKIISKNRIYRGELAPDTNTFYSDSGASLSEFFFPVCLCWSIKQRETKWVMEKLRVYSKPPRITFYPQYERRWLVTPRLKACPKLVSGQRQTMLLWDDHLICHIRLVVYLVLLTLIKTSSF